MPAIVPDKGAVPRRGSTATPPRGRWNHTMVMSSPFVITLSDVDRAELTARAQASKIAYRDALRAKIILGCAAGISRTAIAADLGICDDTVRKWRRCSAAKGWPG